MHKGYVQVYTGHGKGKTTAALGLAIRAAGAGMKVFIAQFIKSKRCSEHILLERLSDLITIRQYGKGLILRRDVTPEDRAAAKEGLVAARHAMASGEYPVVILDEVNVAVKYSLLSVDEIIGLIAEKPPEVELVLTGRDADERIMERADLVTEMKEIRHYVSKGVRSRVGIEE